MSRRHNSREFRERTGQPDTVSFQWRDVAVECGRCHTAGKATIPGLVVLQAGSSVQVRFNGGTHLPVSDVDPAELAALERIAAASGQQASAPSLVLVNRHGRLEWARSTSGLALRVTCKICIASGRPGVSLVPASDLRAAFDQAQRAGRIRARVLTRSLTLAR